MRKKENLNQEWIQKTFRIRPEAINLYSYLEFYATMNNISKDVLFDSIVLFSIDHIATNTPKITIKEYNGKRDVKGFTMSKDTYSLLMEFIKLNRGMKKGQIIEALMGIYAKENLSMKELNVLDFYLLDVE